MTRHKVYLTVTPYQKGNRSGRSVAAGARFKIDEYGVYINADTKNENDVTGRIFITHTDGEVKVQVDCPNYYVNVTHRKEG